jgi:uncharacterized RDD family membrane protein YckC
MQVISQNTYAGFFRRFVAFLIDSIAIRIALLALLGFDVRDEIHISHWGLLNLFSISTLIGELLVAAYFVGMESSSWQATLGKRLLGIRVTDTSYRRISTGTALIRHFSKYLSAVIFMLGYIWVIFDDRRQAWHDKLAGTYVISQ